MAAGTAVSANLPGRFASLSDGIAKLRDEKDAAEMRWLELAEQVEALG